MLTVPDCDAGGQWDKNGGLGFTEHMLWGLLYVLSHFINTITMWGLMTILVFPFTEKRWYNLPILKYHSKKGVERGLELLCSSLLDGGEGYGWKRIIQKSLANFPKIIKAYLVSVFVCYIFDYFTYSRKHIS